MSSIFFYFYIMKILHTADWHLGLKLQNIDLKPDHEYFLSFLLNYIKKEEVDVLMISGDIFDQAYPSQTALGMYYEFLAQLIPLKIDVVITAGNHDAPSVLNGPKEILSQLKIHIFSEINSDNLNQNIISLKRKEEEVHIAAIPFIRDQHLRSYIKDNNDKEAQDQVREGLKHIYDECAAQLKDKLGPKIGMGHLMVLGGTFDQSMREIQVGNLGAFSSQDFSPVYDYIALGHVHKPMKFENGRVRFSGSPIPLSFSEKNYKKHLISLTIKDGNIVDTSEITIPQNRKFIEVKGNTEYCWKQLHQITNEFALLPFLSLEVEEESYQFLEIDKFKTYLETHHLKNFILVKDRYQLLDQQGPKNDISVQDLSTIRPVDILNLALQNEPLIENEEAMARAAFDELLSEIKL